MARQPKLVDVTPTSQASMWDLMKDLPLGQKARYRGEMFTVVDLHNIGKVLWPETLPFTERVTSR